LKGEVGFLVRRPAGERIRLTGDSGFGCVVLFRGLGCFPEANDLVFHRPTMPGLKAQSGNTISSSSSSRVLRRFLFGLAITRRRRV
jgi:hypothetical protein